MRMTRLQRLRARVAGQAGFTLVELLVGMTIGMVVVFAAFTLMERSFVAANDIADRADAAQRGRIAMDAVTRQLRSQVCFSGQLPLLAGSANSIDFVTDLGDGTTSPERHVLTFTSGTNGYSLTETDYPMTSANGATPVTWGTARTKTLLTGIAQNGSAPFFKYLGFDATTNPPTVSTLNSTLVPDDFDNVTQIAVSFTVKPAHAQTSASRGSALSEQVAVPQADPNLSDPAKKVVSATC
jgi:prepilin-type N-terminal cleavage/methylation domain-containing protein